MDGISSLPDEIIRHIVSFLSGKEAALATVLSRRWQSLYTITQNAEFSDISKYQVSLPSFLDGLPALPLSSRVKKVSITSRNRKTDVPSHYTHVNRFLCNVLKRGVLEIELSLWWVEETDSYPLPFEVFTSKTLVELRLGDGVVIDGPLPKNAFLPAVESLFLKAFLFSGSSACDLQALLSACPLLKELVLFD